MNNKYHHIAIALAGVCQSSMLVTQLANTGVCNLTIYECSIKSIFNASPKTTDDVYGGIQNIKIGLQILIQILSVGQKDQVETIRYLFSTLVIANKLLKNNDVTHQIQQRLAHMTRLYANMEDETIHTYTNELSYSLAGIYSDIVSPLSSKIKVIGKVEFLQNLLVQSKVRTSLFSCIRSAILWYQVGGNRLQFIFSRKNIRNAAHELLQEVEKTA